MIASPAATALSLCSSEVVGQTVPCTLHSLRICSTVRANDSVSCITYSTFLDNLHANNSVLGSDALAAVQELQQEKAGLQSRISRLEEQAAQLRGQMESSAREAADAQEAATAVQQQTAHLTAKLQVSI